MQAMWARSKATCTRCRNRVFVELTAESGASSRKPGHSHRARSQRALLFLAMHTWRLLSQAPAYLAHRAGAWLSFGGVVRKYPYAFSGFSLLCPCRRVVHDCCVARTYRAKDGCSETSFHGRRFLGPAVSSFPQERHRPTAGQSCRTSARDSMSCCSH